MMVGWLKDEPEKAFFNYFVNAPPGFGKSLMIALLSGMLCAISDDSSNDFEIEKIYVICYNEYLT